MVEQPKRFRGITEEITGTEKLTVFFEIAIHTDSCISLIRHAFAIGTSRKDVL
jgi:hypothetical protein